MERVLGAAAVRGRVRERADGLEQLDHRAGPAVGDDQRQRVLVGGLHVDEVDVDPVDLGPELRQRVEPRLAAAASRTRSPSTGRAPGSSRAARPASDPGRAPCWAGGSRRGGGELFQRLLRNLDVEGANRRAAGFIGRDRHLVLRWSVTPPTLAPWAARRAREDPGPAALFWTGALSGPPGTAGAARSRGRCGSRRHTTRRTGPAALAARRRPRRR